MNKEIRYFILLWLILIKNNATGQNLVVNFDINDFEITITDSVVNIQTDSLRYYYAENESMPSLPYIIDEISVPYTTSTLNYNVTIQKIPLYDNVYIKQNSRLYCSNDTLYITPEIARTSMTTAVEYLSLAKIAQQAFARFQISPFLYDYTEKKLYFVFSVTISIYDLIYNASKPSNRFPEGSITDSRDSVDYLIITSEDLIEEFKPLCLWKKQKGLKTKIISVEDIYEQYAGSGISKQLKIKQCLYDHYDLGLKWVLLGGDSNIIPIIMCPNRSRSNNPIELITTDLYYACFDDRLDWDANKNGFYGEFGDSADINADICLARLPVRDSSDVVSIVNKILRYEINPDKFNYFDKMLFAGSNPSNEIIENGFNASYEKSKIIHSQISEKWNGDFSFFFDTENSFDYNNEYHLNPSNLIDQINRGYHFFQFIGHGNNTFWKLENNSVYNVNNALMQTNINSSIMTIHSCFTNAFDQEITCLSEALIKNPRGGCVAYWGPTNSLYENFDNSLGQSSRYFAMFYQYLFSGKTMYKSYSLGDITTMVKNDHITHSFYNSYLKHNFLSLNLLGDPEMTIYTECPQNFNASVIIEDSIIHVNCGSVNNCTITMIGVSDSSHVREVKVGSAIDFLMPNEPIIITITKHNYIPFIVNIAESNIYLQNQKYYSPVQFTTNGNIYLGENVIPEVNSGILVADSCSYVEFSSPGKIVFDKGSVCKKGSSITINLNP